MKHFMIILTFFAVLPMTGALGSKRELGTVKFFNVEKGFGFITPFAGDKDIFVHITALERSDLPKLIAGQRVEFDVENRPVADNIVVRDDDLPADLRTGSNTERLKTFD